MGVRADLIDILRDVVGTLAKDEAEVDWPTTLELLDAVRQVADEDASTDPGALTSFVSASNLLTDCVRGVLEPSKVRNALPALDPGPGWENGFSSQRRRGAEVEVEGDESMGFSAMHWRSFLDAFGARLSAVGRAAEDALWDELESGDYRYRLPTQYVSMADPTGHSSAWVTDDGDGGTRLQNGDPTDDLYDALGLDWSQLETDHTRPGEARAVLLSCPLHVRRRAAGTLHCPNALDGWNNLLFVPREPTDAPWPDHGPATARPDNDTPSLPEAIHGPANAATREVEVLPVGYVRVGDRPPEHGSSAASRSLERLRQAVDASSS